MSLLRSLALGLLAGISLTGAACSSAKAPSEGVVGASRAPLTAGEWPEAGIVAKNSAAFAGDSRFTGDVSVINRATGAVLNDAGVELQLGRGAILTGHVKADTLTLARDSRIEGNAAYNVRSGPGVITGTVTPTLTLPLPITLPSLPAIAPGSTAITVPASGTRTLTAGAYAAVKANGRASLTLSGGTYHFASLSLGSEAVLQCVSACEIRVQGSVDFARAARLGGAAASGLGAFDVQLLTAFQSTTPTGTPAIDVGVEARLTAYLFAPNGTTKLRRDAVLNGKLVARDVDFGVASAQQLNLPVIAQQPADLSINERQQAIFSVVATGTGLSYQWLRGSTPIAGATSATYTIVHPTAADSGATFQARVSNGAGTVVTRAASLIVQACLVNDTSCNGRDDDCDGSIDEDYAASPTQCGVGACRATGTRVCAGGAERDTCVPGPAAPSDASCDGVDDDCNGQVDEDYSAHLTQCGAGSCAAQGSTSCSAGQERDSCSPGIPAASDASCDGQDQDCDGVADEDYPSTPTSCGVGACSAGGLTLCSSGRIVDTCQPGSPGATDATCDGTDDDCDGRIDEDYAPLDTSCGAGSCQRTGHTACQAGQELDSCTPGSPGADDQTCDGVDSNCNGQIDEHYASHPTSCGIGACRRTGASSCSGGAEHDNCQPGAPATDDTSCNGLDDDCDGQVDEDFVPVATLCGTGSCAATGIRTCANASVVDSCAPGVAAAVDASCDGLDDDCDGQTDEDFAPAPLSCGTGACSSSGSTRCTAGAEASECTPKPAAASDDSCNNVDDDCDGQTDEDFAAAPTSCGIGACAATGLTSCHAGAAGDSCQPGTPAADDATCNGIDDDCDGQADEDYAPVATACGVGACSAQGSTQCAHGTLTSICVPLTPATLDATCDGIDDDCDGQTDEDFSSAPVSCGEGACVRTGSTRCEGGHLVEDCSTAPATSDDTNCNGVDDDCDGQVDEDFVPSVIGCGVGACTQSGVTRCNAGVISDDCTPAAPTGSDDDCDGVDDDCDGSSDEGFVPQPTSCGQGSCRRDGLATCVSGRTVDSCAPGSAGHEDQTCDGIDADCDGQIDEDYVAHSTTCGVGACRASGVTACQSGHETDSCAPTTPASSSDSTCNGVDDDCDGASDEDFVATATHCGVGACARAGTSSCQAGELGDSCLAGVPATADSTCDGVDDDCDGQTDEAFLATAVSCGVGACAATGSTRCDSGSLVDDCSPKAAAASDGTCDGRDDDCDGQVDEDYVGGATHCGVGACTSTGIHSCHDGIEQDSCAVLPAAASDDDCDGIDDDCDGQVDEGYAAAPTHCGVGACAREGSLACSAGLPVDSCSPGAPAASDANCDGLDDDCDGTADEDYVASPISCGVGACAASGVRACVGGVLRDTCTPLAPAATDASCDGIDDDCDGRADEEFVGTPTHCGSGACQQTGTTSCVAGQPVDSCTPGSPGALDATCDGIDGDCDGLADEDYPPVATHCGVGACRASGVSSCQNGVELSSCVPTGPASGSDDSCDGIDQDCDGTADEDFVPAAVECGVGACRRAGQRSCVDGHVSEQCSPATPAESDALCNDVDDDCDGQVDEDFLPAAVECGVGACRRTGSQSCVAGSLASDCSPGAPAASDASCNGVDDDCDGQVDEDFAPIPTSCGIGACQSTGAMHCLSGGLVSDCAPLEPAATDATCNGTDDDCDGIADEDYVLTPSHCGVGACSAEGTRRCQAGGEVDDCSPPAPAADDASCNGVDDDCDGATDEDYVLGTTYCGVGACAATGQSTCANAAIADSCRAGSAASSDDDCDGVDDDCDGTADEDYVAHATSCGNGACSASGTTACVDGRIIDSCSASNGNGSGDTVCNGIDDDCDGTTDEDYQPSPTTCGVGACVAVGSLVCEAGQPVSHCTPGQPAATDATCDGIDDDCDGTADEDYAPQLTDCGVGACRASGATACVAGQVESSCTAGMPASSDGTCNGLDDDCDGQIDEEYAPIPVTCGVGACARTAQTRCSSGNVVNECLPGSAAADDANCNGLDDDCDGQVDEEYVTQVVHCGVGVCAATGTRACQAGSETSACAPGSPASSDADCNGLDDDCSGEIDEDFSPSPTTCGVGACARSGQTTCTAGVAGDSCTAASPLATSDVTCDGVDDDCSGQADEDYPTQASQCGVGSCAAQGTKRCEGGSVVDNCHPLAAAPLDDDCDGADDDCDSSADEDFQAHTTSCGVGACRAEGIATCAAGQQHDSCQPTLATSPDNDCDGVDDDCDGTVDQNYVGSPISCGIGACRNTGTTICAAGVVSSSCDPHQAAASDGDCNGIDDDCDGSIDEDYEVRCSGTAVQRCQLGALQLLECGDSSPCNGSETCAAGACKPGTPPPLDDHDPCTTDSCDSALGVVHAPARRGTSCGAGRACDGAGQCASLPVIEQAPGSVTVDTGQPMTLVVSATGQDLSYQWRRFGQNILGATEATFVLPAVTIVDTGAEFSVVVSNAAGSVTSPTAILTVHDSTGPLLSVDGSSVRSVSTDLFSVTGTAHDPGSSVAAVSVSSDRFTTEFAAILNGTTGAFSAQVPLRVADNILTVQARDVDGNVSTRTLVVTLLLDVLPRIQITEPADGGLMTTDLITLRGVVRSTLQPEQIRLVLGGDVRFPTGTGNEYAFEFQSVHLQRGTNALTVRAETSAGNSSAQVVVRYGDDGSAQAGEKPAIRLIGVQRESFTSASSRVVSGTVTAKRCVSRVTMNGQVVTLRGSGSEVSFDHLLQLPAGEAEVAVTVTALDCDGLESELKFTLLHDDVAPVFSLALTAAPAEHRFTQTPVTVSGTITERYLAGVAMNQQSIGVLPGQNGSWDFNVAIPLTRNATQSIAFEAWDRAGNRASYTVELALDAAFDIDVLAPTTGSELITLDASTQLDVVARVTGLPEDQYLTASIDALPGIRLSRAASTFTGSLPVSGVSAKHSLSVVARRADGASLAEKSVPFSVKAGRDIPLELTFQNPLNGSQNVEANQPIIMSFNRPVELPELAISVEETAHGKQYKPLPPGSGFTEFTNVELIDVNHDAAPVPGGPSLLPGGRSVIFYPSRDYAYGGVIQVTVKHQSSELARERFDVRPMATLVSGIVTDQALTPLEGVTVSLPDLGVTDVTNHEGAFSFGFGTVDKAIPAGRHRLIVNPGLRAPAYGTLVRYVDAQAGRRVDVGALTARLLSRSEPFRPLSSGEPAASFLSGAAILDLSQAELSFPNGQRQGNVQAELLFGPALGFQMPSYVVPFISLAFQPMGVEVAGSVGLDLALPPEPTGKDYAASLPDRVLIAGVDAQALELVPIGVGLVDRASSRIRSERPLALTRLDYVTLVPVADAYYQDLLRRYGVGELSLSELVSQLGITP